MPISNTEFSRARKVDPTDVAIKEFLRQNRDKAYAPSEIADALGLRKGESVWEDLSALVTIQSRLDHMAERGDALRRRVLGRWYYKAPR